LESDVPDPSVDRFLAASGEADRGVRRRGGQRFLRPGGPLFFANADDLRDRLVEAASDPDAQWIVLDLERVSDVDPTAAEALAEGIQVAHDHGAIVVFSRVARPIHELLDRYDITSLVGVEHVYTSNRAARVADPREGDRPER
jgi:sulfate permease, SulP family